MSKKEQQPLTANEQVSIILAHTNRAITQVSKETELAVIKVVSQNQEIVIQYQELMNKYIELKNKYEPEKKQVIQGDKNKGTVLQTEATVEKKIEKTQTN